MGACVPTKSACLRQATGASWWGRGITRRARLCLCAPQGWAGDLTLLVLTLHAEKEPRHSLHCCFWGSGLCSARSTSSVPRLSESWILDPVRSTACSPGSLGASPAPQHLGLPCSAALGAMHCMARRCPSATSPRSQWRSLHPRRRQSPSEGLQEWSMAQRAQQQLGRLGCPWLLDELASGLQIGDVII
jgi:hypothetical protein